MIQKQLFIQIFVNTFLFQQRLHDNHICFMIKMSLAADFQVGYVFLFHSKKAVKPNFCRHLRFKNSVSSASSPTPKIFLLVLFANKFLIFLFSFFVFTQNNFVQQNMIVRYIFINSFSYKYQSVRLSISNPFPKQLKHFYVN